MLVRIELDDALEARVEAVSRAHLGCRRTDVVRAAVRLGLAQIEAEIRGEEQGPGARALGEEAARG